MEASGRASISSLSSITTLKKLCNHPSLVFEKALNRDEGFEGALEMFPRSSHDQRRVEPELSGKMLVLDLILAVVKSTTDDKVAQSCIE